MPEPVNLDARNVSTKNLRNEYRGRKEMKKTGKEENALLSERSLTRAEKTRARESRN